MRTQEAYQQYLIDANNNANFMSTLLWIFFTLFVIAPILYVVGYSLTMWVIHKKNQKKLVYSDE